MLSAHSCPVLLGNVWCILLDLLCWVPALVWAQWSPGYFLLCACFKFDLTECGHGETLVLGENLSVIVPVLWSAPVA
jgi:hypothetical protein